MTYTIYLVQVDFPVKANGDAVTVKATNKVCVRSNGLVRYPIVNNVHDAVH